MKTGTATTRRRLLAVLIALALPGAAVALLAEPSATGASDPCAASEVARTVGRSPSRWATTWIHTQRPTR